MVEQIVKIPKAYVPLFEEARKRRKKLLDKGFDVSLFKLMIEIELEKKKNEEIFKGFRL